MNFKLKIFKFKAYTTFDSTGSYSYYCNKKSLFSKICFKKYTPWLAPFFEVKLFHCFLKWCSRCVPEHVRNLSALELRVIVYGTWGLSLKWTEWTRAHRRASQISSEHVAPRVNTFVNFISGRSYRSTVWHTEAASRRLGLTLPLVYSRIYIQFTGKNILKFIHSGCSIGLLRKKK